MRQLIKLKQCKELTTVNTKTNSFSEIKSHDACQSQYKIEEIVYAVYIV